jgi:hypothetical protein
MISGNAIPIARNLEDWKQQCAIITDSLLNVCEQYPNYYDKQQEQVVDEHDN